MSSQLSPRLPSPAPTVLTEAATEAATEAPRRSRRLNASPPLSQASGGETRQRVRRRMGEPNVEVAVLQARIRELEAELKESNSVREVLTQLNNKSKRTFFCQLINYAQEEVEDEEIFEETYDDEAILEIVQKDNLEFPDFVVLGKYVTKAYLQDLIKKNQRHLLDPFELGKKTSERFFWTTCIKARLLAEVIMPNSWQNATSLDVNRLKSFDVRGFPDFVNLVQKNIGISRRQLKEIQ